MKQFFEDHFAAIFTLVSSVASLSIILRFCKIHDLPLFTVVNHIGASSIFLLIIVSTIFAFISSLFILPSTRNRSTLIDRYTEIRLKTKKNNNLRNDFRNNYRRFFTLYGSGVSLCFTIFIAAYFHIDTTYEPILYTLIIFALATAIPTIYILSKQFKTFYHFKRSRKIKIAASITFYNLKMFISMSVLLAIAIQISIATQLYQIVGPDLLFATIIIILMLSLIPCCFHPSITPKEAWGLSTVFIVWIASTNPQLLDNIINKSFQKLNSGYNASITIERKAKDQSLIESEPFNVKATLITDHGIFFTTSSGKPGFIRSTAYEGYTYSFPKSQKAATLSEPNPQAKKD